MTILALLWSSQGVLASSDESDGESSPRSQQMLRGEDRQVDFMGFGAEQKRACCDCCVSLCDHWAELELSKCCAEMLLSRHLSDEESFGTEVAFGFESILDALFGGGDKEHFD